MYRMRIFAFGFLALTLIDSAHANSAKKEGCTVNGWIHQVMSYNPKGDFLENIKAYVVIKAFRKMPDETFSGVPDEMSDQIFGDTSDEVRDKHYLFQIRDIEPLIYVINAKFENSFIWVQGEEVCKEMGFNLWGGGHISALKVLKGTREW